MSETEKCGFCFAEYFEMIDPRQMACGHVFCLPCMQEHYENSQGVECAFKHCSEICPHDKVTDLPKYKDTEKAEEIEVETRSYCDCEGCEGKKAICYCIDCGKCLCKFHNEHHPAYFQNHSLIDIQLFEEEPEAFIRPICEIHGDPLCRACEDCTKLVCNECDVLEKSCNGNHHKLKGFGRFEREVNEEFDKMMKSASERLTEMCKIEKRVWNKHEDVINQYDDLITEVDVRTEQQISVLREEAEKKKEKLREKQKSVTQRAVDFTTESVERRTEIELLRSRLSRLKDYAHVTEKIKQREERKKEMQTCLQAIKGDSNDLNCREIIGSTDGQIRLNFAVLTPPNKLGYKSSHDMKRQCATVHRHSATGNLLIGCASGVKRMSSAGGDVINMTDHHWARAAEYDGEIFISTHKDEIVLILKYKPSEYGAEEHEELFRFSAKNTEASFLSVSAKYIAATDKDTKTIQLYNRATKSVTSRALPGHTYPYNHHFLPDGSLLVTGLAGTAYKLIKYRIPEEEDKQLEIIWTCEGLRFPFGVSSDEKGLIYVAGAENKTIYIINEGKLVQTLAHDNLPSHYEDMSVRGDQLAVAGWNENNVLLFDLIVE